MKSDRRHELQKNELADWLGEHVEAIKPHAPAIALGVLALVVLVVGSIWYFGSEDRAAAQTWSSYFAAFNQREPGKVLEQLAKDKPGTTTALWATQAVGDMSAAQGSTMLFSDRADAKKLLEKAEESYKQVESRTSDPDLKIRAQLGLGKVYESLCKPADAAKYYDLVAASQKDNAIGKLAAADAKRMKDEREVALLAWFAEQQPKRPAPIPGAGGNAPGLPNDLPERPDIGLPSGLGLGNLGAGVPAALPPALPEPGKATPGEPKAPDAKAEESKGADEKAKESPPADEKGKSDEKAESKAGDAKPGS